MASPPLRSLRTLSRSRLRGVEYINLLALIVGILSGLFIITGAPVVIVILPLVTAIGMEGVLHSHPAGRIRTAAESALDLVTPVAFVLAAALFFRWAASSYWTVLAAIATAMLFALVAYAAYYVRNAEADEAGAYRLAIVGLDYVTLLAFLSVFYAHDLTYPAAALLAGVAGLLAAIDVFRDADLQVLDHAIYAIAAAVFLAQARWALGFVRIDGILAAVLLLVAFYVACGVTIAALTRRLDRRAGAEFLAVAIAGIVVVAFGRLISGG